MTDEQRQALEFSPNHAAVHLEMLSLSLSEEALAELAEVLGVPAGPLHYEAVTAALMATLRATAPTGSPDRHMLLVWALRSKDPEVTLCLALPGIAARLLYAARLTPTGVPWVVESAVQAVWGDIWQVGQGEPLLRFTCERILLRRGTAIGAGDPEETLRLGRLLGGVIAPLRPGMPAAPVAGPSQTAAPRALSGRHARTRGGESNGADRRPRTSVVEGPPAQDYAALLGLNTPESVESGQPAEAATPTALFDWVETQTTTMVIPPDLSAAAATVLEGMEVTPLAFHLYWLRRAVEAQFEREVSLAAAQTWRYDIVPPSEAVGSTDEVTVRVTRQKGNSATPDVGENVEPPGTNGATGWRVVRVDGHVVTLRPGSGESPALPPHGLLVPRANRRVAEVKRETIDRIAGGRNGASTLRALMADPSSAHCAMPDDNGGGPLEDSGDPGLVGHLYPSQKQAARQAVVMRQGDVLLIQGPPGTGKTTTIVAIVRALVAKGARILLCSQSNLGVDNALERLHAAEPKLGLVRVGNPELVLPSVRPLLVEETSGGEGKVDRAPVVGGTCAGVALSRAVGARTYDYVIVDEANKARMDEMMLACARGERLILVGDHNQLPPFPDEACTALLQAHPEASPLAGTISLFDWLVGMGIPANCRLLLDEQNRMAPELAAFISETFYGGRVRNGPRVQEYGPVVPAPLDRTLIFVDTAGMAGSGERVGRGGSIANTLEANLVARAVAWLDQHSSRDLTLGVISGYREQVAIIRRLVSRKPTTRSVHIDTVDSFEGREEDIIVASLVRSNDLGRVGFLREASRLNVALSRACRMLLIVGDSRTITGSPDPEVARRFKSLLAHVYRHGIIVPAGSFLQPPRPTRRAPAEQGRRPAASRASNRVPGVAAAPNPSTSGRSAPISPSRGRGQRGGAPRRPPVGVVPAPVL